jgi:KUP system potassium uptake protein
MPFPMITIFTGNRSNPSVSPLAARRVSAVPAVFRENAPEACTPWRFASGPLWRYDGVHRPSGPDNEPGVLDASMTSSEAEGLHRDHQHTRLLAALGIVFGDIGTSPLYAVRACFRGPFGIEATPGNVVGVLSAIVWSLILVVSIKYLIVVMKADNRGEGGILALMALLLSCGGSPRKRLFPVMGLGIFGAALLFGDGIITPAISVLSAVEGLQVATPAFVPYVLPLAVLILFGLFAIQSRGTARIGGTFGFVMAAWFAVLAALGSYRILSAPTVLAALNPYYAVHFFAANGLRGFSVLGAIFLAVTGAEVLYADIGHFGKRPIRWAWYMVVFPALLANYLGQGALLLRHPEAVGNPFFRMVPPWGLYPLVALATAATIIASQAVISGVFSLSHQAMQLDFSPRMRVRHSSPMEIGQVYVPSMNWLLLAATLVIVLAFRSSDNLAAAYGVAVSTTMVITTILALRCALRCWSWPAPAAALVFGAFLFVDLLFFGFNSLKILQGGWLPLAIAVLVFFAMTSWNRGFQQLIRLDSAGSLPVDPFLRDLRRHPPVRVPGTAVYLGSPPELVPRTLLHNLKHNKVVHAWVLLVQVQTTEIPRIPREERAEVQALGQGFVHVVARYGFMENPDIPRLLGHLTIPAWTYSQMDATYFLGRETCVVSTRGWFQRLRKQLFVLLHRNIHQDSDYYRLPPNRVVELGTQIRL